MATGSEILLTPQQHFDLSSIAQSRSLPAGYVFRAKTAFRIVEGQRSRGRWNAHLRVQNLARRLGRVNPDYDRGRRRLDSFFG